MFPNKITEYFTTIKYSIIKCVLLMITELFEKKEKS